MEGIALFVARDKEDFFVEKARINCTIGEFYACNNAHELLDTEAVMKRRLMHIGCGMKVPEPVRVESGTKVWRNSVLRLALPRRCPDDIFLQL